MLVSFPLKASENGVSLPSQLAVPSSTGRASEVLRKLYRDLMVNYNRLERPVQNDSAPIVVDLGLTLLQIIDVELPTHSCHMRLGIFLYQEEPRAHCTSIRDMTPQPINDPQLQTFSRLSQALSVNLLSSQCSSCSSSHYGADTSPVAGLMPFHCPVQLSLCNGRSPELDYLCNLIVLQDEKNQVMITNAWLQLTWTDVYLSWNPESYPGVQNLRFPSHQIWVPDILLYNRSV
ncbi:unnamed protein product [Pleuronectes platessa]|uniref:Neurotransmitter-gated ion-channel ligand-binding domain-containing protein n=1 Tax=Pleuronectes platessa TaxID=8262 RepID=A0A9N7UH90_PLEPL|nr:unnamed protein product [Pleuronectes platessa]